MEQHQSQQQLREYQATLPELVTLDELAALLRRAKSTILADLSAGSRGRPELVPPGGFHNGSGWLWFKSDVLQFLQDKRNAAIAAHTALLAAKEGRKGPAVIRRRGAPTKAERVARGRV